MTNTPTVLTEAQIGEIEARDAYYLGEVTCDTPKYVHDSPYLLLDRRALLRHIRSTPVVTRVTPDELRSLNIAIGTLESIGCQFDRDGCKAEAEPYHDAGAYLRCLASRHITSSPPAVDWVEWKAGDPKPNGEHHLTTVHRFCVDRLQICPTKDFAKNSVIAYWPIPLPPAYAPQARKDGV